MPHLFLENRVGSKRKLVAKFECDFSTKLSKQLDHVTKSQQKQDLGLQESGDGEEDVAAGPKLLSRKQVGNYNVIIVVFFDTTKLR